MVVNELYGVLHGDDVALLGSIPVIDHGGEGRRFSRAGCAHEKTRPRFVMTMSFRIWGSPRSSIVFILYLYLPEDQLRHEAPLLKMIHPEPSQSG